MGKGLGAPRGRREGLWEAGGPVPTLLWTSGVLHGTDPPARGPSRVQPPSEGQISMTSKLPGAAGSFH